MSVCEFLQCLLSELPQRIKNPADYMTILAYLHEKDERLEAKMPKPRGSFNPKPMRR